eukprot:6957893-Alexandrium_andersonii.AAC.1
MGPYARPPLFGGRERQFLGSLNWDLRGSPTDNLRVLGPCGSLDVLKPSLPGCTSTRTGAEPRPSGPGRGYSETSLPSP